MNSFLLIDKPLDYSSFDVLKVLRKKLSMKKIGHSGTLDPLATWLLLVASWNYTKLFPYLDYKSKTYTFKISLDWTTSSYDLAEEVIYLNKDKQDYYSNNLKKSDIEKILKDNFLWKISQIPPKYSALKVNWKRAYDLARSWEDFDMKKRDITIHDIKILSYTYPDLVLEARVSTGTYIRSIANDLWEMIWSWAYIKTLRRTWIWELLEKYSQKLDDFDKSKLIDEKLLFWDRIISLEENLLSKINFWLKQEVSLDLKDWVYFVRNNDKITNIVSYEKGLLIPKKRIL